MSERAPAIEFAINMERTLTFTWPTGKTGETNGRAWEMWSVQDEAGAPTVMFPKDDLGEKIAPLVAHATREAPVSLSIKKIQTVANGPVTWAVEPAAGATGPPTMATELHVNSANIPPKAISAPDKPVEAVPATAEDTDAQWLVMAQQLASARQMADIAAQVAQLDATPETWAATLFIEANKRGLPPLSHLNPDVDEPNFNDEDVAQVVETFSGDLADEPPLPVGAPDPNEAPPMGDSDLPF
jgi:hypothetical protein